MMLDNSPRADLQRLRESRSRELRIATEHLDKRQASLARLATIDAEINDYENDERARNRRRRIAHQKLASSYFRDASTPKAKALHLEIIRQYAWGQKERRAPRRRGSPALLAVLRLCQLERLWNARYGGVLPNDDAGTDDLWIAAQLIRHHEGDISAKIVAWARKWAPWCSSDEAVRLAARVLRRPHKFTADVLGEKVGLTYAERQALGITAIGSTDVGPAERERLRRDRYNAKRKEKRRAAGVTPRDLYEGTSNESRRPWEEERISPSTWYRRRRAARVCGGPSRVEPSNASENPRTLAVENGSLEAPNGSLSAGSGDDRGEKRASAARDITVASADCEAVVAGDRPVSSGSLAPVVPGADVAREDPLAPPRPHALRQRTARPSVEDGGLGFLQNFALNARLGPQLSNEGRSVQGGIFRAWNNCCICAEPFRVRGREELFCGDDCRQLSRVKRGIMQ